MNASRTPVKMRSRLILLLIGACLATPAMATQLGDNPQVRAALEQLLRDVEQVSAGSAAAARAGAAGGSGRIVVQRGDTLDGVIARTMGGVPVQRALLRQAFVRANPHAFPRGNPNFMLAGVTLTIPDVNDLRRVVFTEAPRQAPPNEDRRHWIRYP